MYSDGTCLVVVLEIQRAVRYPQYGQLGIFYVPNNSTSIATEGVFDSIVIGGTPADCEHSPGLEPCTIRI